MGQFWKRYDTALWVRAWGTALTSLTGFMLRPFLVLYLYEKMSGSILLPMVIVGLQPLTGMLVSLWGGGLSDRFGRKPVMLVAQMIQTVSMAGYIFADSVWAFACITIMNGLGNALFSPAANAQISDVVPEEKRAEAFALLHTALNVGAAAGPLIGLVMFTQNPQLVFGMSAATMLIYAVILWWKVPETYKQHGEQQQNQKQQAPTILARQHAPLFWMTLLAIPVGLLYAQVETVFPLHLKGRFADYQTMFAWLMMINGTAVILLQMWIAKRTEHMSSRKVLLVAYLCLTVVALGYGFAPTFALLVLVELLFTVGEMLFGPHMQKMIAAIAPLEMRGRYFSVYGLNWQISRGLGPIMGGAVFAQWGGTATFGLVAFLLICAGLFQYRMIHRVQRKKEKQLAMTAPVS